MSESGFSELIETYIQTRASAKFEKFDKEANKSRKAVSADEVALAALNVDLSQKRMSLEEKYTVSAWLADAASRAKQISLVTHAIKFIHTDAKGTSLYASEAESSEYDERYLSTAVLSNIKEDVVGNAAALDVASLLQLSVDGISLVSLLAKGDVSALAPFAENEDQLAQWCDGLLGALAAKELSSHKLAKQLYFPVSEDSYHLISPLYASSLSQQLYQRVADSRYSDAAKGIRKAKKEGRYNKDTTVDYLNVAVQNFGGTKPQNVSQLNSSRGGKSFLLSCQPPVWTTRQLPPAQHKDAFWMEFEKRSWKNVNLLKQYLNKQKLNITPLI